MPAIAAPEAETRVIDPLKRLLVYREWASKPGRVAFVWMLLGLSTFALLTALGDRGSDGVLVYLAAWAGLSLVVPRVVTRELRAPEYVALSLALAMVEETLAYLVGGGLHGAATSLAEDWVRSVPTFGGLAVALVVSARTLGTRPGETFLGAAAAGVVLEFGVGNVFDPVAWVVLSGAVAWVYGTILALPLRGRPAAARPAVRITGTVGLLAVGAALGAVLGLAISIGLRL